MSTWSELREELGELQRDERQPLLVYPDPSADDVRPPYRIRLEAWADGVAARLHARFGAEVDLTVGFLHFPDRRRAPLGGGQAADGTAPQPLLSAREVTFSLDEPVEAPSGHTVRASLRADNHRAGEVVMTTSGALTARVLDPGSGEPVGGFPGAQTMPVVRFRIPPGRSVPVPLLVGTASLVPELGYAIPPGLWAVDAELRLEEGPCRTPPLPIRIVP